MIHQGKNYNMEYDDSLLELEVRKAFDDQVILILRQKNVSD
jgi:hypothetical protein